MAGEWIDLDWKGFQSYGLQQSFRRAASGDHQNDGLIWRDQSVLSPPNAHSGCPSVRAFADNWQIDKESAVVVDAVADRRAGS